MSGWMNLKKPSNRSLAELRAEDPPVFELVQSFVAVVPLDGLDMGDHEKMEAIFELVDKGFLSLQVKRSASGFNARWRMNGLTRWQHRAVTVLRSAKLH